MIEHHPFWENYPRIASEHLRHARLYASRSDLIHDALVRRHGKIAEIGVWRGEFSKLLIEALRPREFYAFDVFNCHLLGDWNGQTGRQIFEGLTHRQFYEREMRPFQEVVNLVEGASPHTLRPFADHSFDLVYVDANHHHEEVKADAEAAVEMVAETGLLIFNDYTVLDPGTGARFGVVPVVNDLIVNHGWSVTGFALELAMYCDVALRRTEFIRDTGDVKTQVWPRLLGAESHPVQIENVSSFTTDPAGEIEVVENHMFGRHRVMANVAGVDIREVRFLARPLGFRQLRLDITDGTAGRVYLMFDRHPGFEVMTGSLDCALTPLSNGWFAFHARFPAPTRLSNFSLFSIRGDRAEQFPGDSSSGFRVADFLVN